MVHFVFSPYKDGFGPYLGTGFFLRAQKTFPSVLVLIVD